MEMLARAGVKLFGFNSSVEIDVPEYITLSVEANSVPGAPFRGTSLITDALIPGNVRVFRAPSMLCPENSRDAMILRNCTSDSKIDDYVLEYRTFDILLMKFCEEHTTYPWRVCAINEVTVPGEADEGTAVDETRDEGGYAV
ncbi:hypothetical protein GQ53DRAFT_747752 [Thozetella sp. PMI_491]|nr:hypothetical protein GQ53DRAFT_747752 [Thozetella sp. PMI_491]